MPLFREYRSAAGAISWQTTKTGTTTSWLTTEILIYFFLKMIWFHEFKKCKIHDFYSVMLCICTVCRRALSVRLFVMFVHSVETSKYIGQNFSPSGRSTVLGFSIWQYSDGDRPGGDCDCDLLDRWLLQRLVSSTFRFRRWSKVTALSGGVCLSRRTDDEAPRISESCLWVTASFDEYAEENGTEFNCTHW